MINDDSFVRLIRVARGLEAEGFYNEGKLLRAVAFSEEIRSSNRQGIPRRDALKGELSAAIDQIRKSGRNQELIEALVRGEELFREEKTIPYAEIPPVFICRICGEIMVGEMRDHCPTCHAPGLTFHQTLPAYYMDVLTPQQVMAAYASAPDAVEEAIRGMSNGQMNQRPEPDEWSVREVLLEICGANLIVAARIEKLLTENYPSLSSIAIPHEQIQSLSGTDLMQRFRESREALVRRLAAIAFEDWWRTGRHVEWGDVTVLDQATYFARHERGHIPQIEAARQAIGA